MGGLFISNNNGSSWEAASTGLSDTIILSVAVGDTNLFVGTAYYGVWRRPLSDFGISSVTQALTAPTSDIQSYPNPFSQSTQISFTSPDAGYADISIVNLLGEQVARIFSGELDAGEHNFTFQANGLPDRCRVCAKAPGRYCYCRHCGDGHTGDLLHLSP